MTPVTPGHPVSPDGSDIPCADGSASPGAVAAESRLLSLASARGKALLALAALWLFCGCGGSDLAFTGGSIPPGGTRLVGRVAAAENPLEPLANAVVQVKTQPVTGGVRTLQATTAMDGTFRFISVPTGSTFTTMTVTVTPDPAQNRQSQQVVFQAQNGVTDDLVVALPLNSFDVKQAVSLTLGPIATVQQGDSAVIHAHLFASGGNSGGNRLPVEPTLLYSGNFGSIAIDETFSATEPGSGTITAFWYSLTSVTTPVVAVLPDPALPPAPPIQPDVPPFIVTSTNSPTTH